MSPATVTAPRVRTRPRSLRETDADWVPLNSDSLHDLVGPAGRVCCLADLLFKRYRGRLDEEADLMLDLIQNSTNRLQTMLGGIDRYLRAVNSPSSRRRCDGDVLLAEALASIRPLIDKSGAFITHDPVPAVECAPDQIRLVLANLIENSIHFGGEKRPQIHCSAPADAARWGFSVTDNGIGIAAENHKRIFEVFRTVPNETYSGAGVGLAIVQRIVEFHGGEISVESSIGRGSTVTIWLDRNASRETSAVARSE